MGGTRSTYGKKIYTHDILVESPQGKIPRRTWENNIKMDLKEIDCEGVERIILTWDKILCIASSGLIKARNFLTSLATGNISEKTRHHGKLATFIAAGVQAKKEGSVS
jgi:hypothetical protein